jgi:hypothetical protein
MYTYTFVAPFCGIEADLTNLVALELTSLELV